MPIGQDRGARASFAIANHENKFRKTFVDRFSFLFPGSSFETQNTKHKTQKGQLTVEYLLLSAIALSLLMISVYALIRIKESSESSLELIQFRSSALELHSTMETLCALGDGNTHPVYLKRNISISSMSSGEMYSITFTDAQTKSKLTRICRCDVEASTANHQGKTTVSNENGKIKIV